MNLSPLPIQKFFDNNGRPLDGGLLFTYESGTSNKIATYTNAGGMSQNTNPIVLDFRGEANVWLDPELTYKFVLAREGDTDPPSNPIWTVDNIAAGITYADLIAIIDREFIGGVLWPRTAAEIAAGVTPVYYYYEPGDVRRYGMVGDWNGTTGTDNASAMRNAFLVLQAGAPFLDFGSGRYLINVSGGGANMSALSGLNGFKIITDGCEFHFQGTYTGSQFIEGISATDCSNWSIEGSHKVTSRPLESGGSQAARGVEWVKIWDGCTNVKTGPIYADGVRSVITWRRDSTLDPKGSGGFHELINCVDCGYGLNTIRSGDNLTANIIAVRPVRSYYPYGIDNHVININSQDHWGNADANISSALGEGCSNLYLKYTNLNSTVADNSISCVKVSFTDETPAIHRNINITLDVSAATSADCLGFSFVLEKLNNAGSPDPVDRGHRLDSLTVDHILNAKNVNQRSINMSNIGTWGTGEFITNPKFTRIRSDGGGQINFLLASVQDVMTIDNLYSSATVNVAGPTISGTRLNVSGANVSAWAVTAGNNYLMDERDVTVAYSASITIDSFLGTSFIITATNGSAFTINAPTNPAPGKVMNVAIRNASGGALGAATWNAVFKMSAWTQPANGQNRSITFRYDGTNWVQVSQTGVDVPN